MQVLLQVIRMDDKWMYYTFSFSSLSISTLFCINKTFFSLSKRLFLSAKLCKTKKSLKLLDYDSSYFKSWFLSHTIVYSSETVSDIYCVPLAFRSSMIPWTEVLYGVCLWLVGTSTLSLCTCREGWWQRCWTASATTKRIL